MERKNLLKLAGIGGVLVLIAVALWVVLGEGLVSPAPLLTPTPRPPLPDIEVSLPPTLDELADQYPDIAPILRDPELATVYKEFLIAYQEGGVEAAMDLAVTRGLLTPDGASVRVTLVLDTDDSALLVQELEALGLHVASAYRDRVNVAVPVALIEAQLQSDQPGAIFSHLTQLDHVIAVRLPTETIPHQRIIEGEGVAIINADIWHQAGVTGEGLRIGVLDLGFAGHEDLLGTDLPSSVVLETFGWYDQDEVHGTACAEIVYEVAPGADLVFAWYDGSEAAMGEAVAWLLTHDVDIITHSAGALVGPRDGSGWKATLVDDVAARGIIWVNSAGNEGKKHYRATFTDTSGNGIHEFAPGEEMLALYNRGKVLVFLQWEDDWERPTRDYELYLVNERGEILAASEDAQSGELGQEPFEGIFYLTGGNTVYAMVTVYDSDKDVVFDIFTGPGVSLDYVVPEYSLTTPSDAVGSLTVGAVNWWDDRLAGYSSQGPTSDGRLKPEISAPAGVSGHSYGISGFDGTSASTPHVAAAAALVWEANPHFSRQEVIDFLLAEAVVDLGPPGPDTGYGYGRLSLPEHVEVVPPPPPEAPTPESPGPTPTPAPLPTPTPVSYVTPEPVGRGGPQQVDDLLSLTLIGLLVIGLGCGGAGLLGVSGLVLVVGMARRGRRRTALDARPAPPGPPPPPARHGAYDPRPAPPPSGDRPAPVVLKCPACSATLRRSDAQFCVACGHSLHDAPPRRASRCRHCGADLREGARFCSRCGHAVD